MATTGHTGVDRPSIQIYLCKAFKVIQHFFRRVDWLSIRMSRRQPAFFAFQNSVTSENILGQLL